MSSSRPGPRAIALGGCFQELIPRITSPLLTPLTVPAISVVEASLLSVSQSSQVEVVGAFAIALLMDLPKRLWLNDTLAECHIGIPSSF